MPRIEKDLLGKSSFFENCFKITLTCILITHLLDKLLFYQSEQECRECKVISSVCQAFLKKLFYDITVEKMESRM